MHPSTQHVRDFTTTELQDYRAELLTTIAELTPVDRERHSDEQRADHWCRAMLATVNDELGKRDSERLGENDRPPVEFDAQHGHGGYCPQCDQRARPSSRCPNPIR